MPVYEFKIKKMSQAWKDSPYKWSFPPEKNS